MEKQHYILREGVCSVRYPACIAHAPCYIVICGLSGSTVFFHMSHKRHDFRPQKRYCPQNVCFDFLYNFVRIISHSKKTSTIHNQSPFAILRALLQINAVPYMVTQNACTAIHFATHAYQTCCRTRTARKGERVNSFLVTDQLNAQTLAWYHHTL